MKPAAKSIFAATDAELLFSKNDPADPRLGEMARRLDDATPETLGAACRAAIAAKGRAIALAGYADDEGIRLNGGRPGAAEAPPQVRRAFYKMTPSFLSAAPLPAIIDVGDLKPGHETLGERHQSARAMARAAIESGALWLAIGGGHDYGFADAAAFADVCATLDGGKGIRPLVINFDAHLDVRPYRRDNAEVYSSGTPFARLLDAFPEIDFAEIGLQSQCNSRAHCDWLLARGGRALFHEEVEATGRPLAELAMERLGEWAERRRPTFLSVDIDAFSNAWAPGCSQSFATGLTPASFFPLLQILLKRLDVRGLAIYETSPPLDEGGRTSRLAAQILHRAACPL